MQFATSGACSFRDTSVARRPPTGEDGAGPSSRRQPSRSRSATIAAHGDTRQSRAQSQGHARRRPIARQERDDQLPIGLADVGRSETARRLMLMIFLLHQRRLTFQAGMAILLDLVAHVARLAHRNRCPVAGSKTCRCARSGWSVTCAPGLRSAPAPTRAVTLAPSAPFRRHYSRRAQIDHLLVA